MAMLPDSNGGGLGATPAAQRRSQQIMNAPSPTAPRPAPHVGNAIVRRTTAPIQSNSKGSYSRPAAPPPATPGPIVPSIDAFLNQDSGYQQQLRDFALALNNFNADITRRKGGLESEYGLSKDALSKQRGIDLQNLEADYGSRGLLRSGLYGKAVGDYETEYGQRVSDLDRRQNDALNALTQETSQFNSTNDLKQQAAREAAIRRRAEQYGV